MWAATQPRKCLLWAVSDAMMNTGCWAKGEKLAGICVSPEGMAVDAALWKQGVTVRGRV